MKAKTLANLKFIWSFIWKIGFLILFIYIIVTQSMKMSSAGARIALIAFAFLVIGFYIYSELLSHQFKKALYLLNISCDVDACRKVMETINKYDMKHGYQGNLCVLETLILQDQLQYDELLKYIDANEKTLKSSPEGILICYYSQLKAAAYRQDTALGASSFEKCSSILSAKVKGKRISQIYSIDEIKGLENLSSGKNKQAFKCFEQVPMERMNIREQVQLLYFQKLAAKRMKDFNKAHALSKQLQSYCGTSTIVKEGGRDES